MFIHQDETGFKMLSSDLNNKGYVATPRDNRGQHISGRPLEPLQTKLRVRAEPHQLQPLHIRFPVDQHKIRLDVAVSMVIPFARKRVVSVTFRQWFILRQGFYKRKKGVRTLKIQTYIDV